MSLGAIDRSHASSVWELAGIKPKSEGPAGEAVGVAAAGVARYYVSPTDAWAAGQTFASTAHIPGVADCYQTYRSNLESRNLNISEGLRGLKTEKGLLGLGTLVAGGVATAVSMPLYLTRDVESYGEIDIKPWLIGVDITIGAIYLINLFFNSIPSIIEDRRTVRHLSRNRGDDYTHFTKCVEEAKAAHAEATTSSEGGTESAFTVSFEQLEDAGWGVAIAKVLHGAWKLVTTFSLSGASTLSAGATLFVPTTLIHGETRPLSLSERMSNNTL